MIEYDFDDDAIRKMIEKYHFPEENWIALSEEEGDEMESINCSKCFQYWPCIPIQNLRRWRALRAPGEEQ